MRVIPALHHLEILALRERLNSGLSHWQTRMQAPSLEEFVAMHAVLREGVKSIRAGREFLVALLISWLLGLQEDATEAVAVSAQNYRQLEPRINRSFQEMSGANHALRYQKSCVLWSRYLS